MYYSITERKQETVILSKCAGKILLNAGIFHNTLHVSFTTFNILQNKAGLFPDCPDSPFDISRS